MTKSGEDVVILNLVQDLSDAEREDAETSSA
jgi:hypothetical protein